MVWSLVSMYIYRTTILNAAARYPYLFFKQRGLSLCLRRITFNYWKYIFYQFTRKPFSYDFQILCGIKRLPTPDIQDDQSLGVPDWLPEVCGFLWLSLTLDMTHFAPICNSNFIVSIEKASFHKAEKYLLNNFVI